MPRARAAALTASRAVDGVSMAFQRGRLTGIIGPNGAGKSTVLAMLAGTLPADRGADPATRAMT